MAEQQQTIVGVTALAQLFDLTERRIQQLTKEGVLPRAERGRYPLVPAVRAYVRYLRELAKGEEGANIAQSIRVQQLRRITIDNDLKEGRALDADAVEEIFFTTVHNVSAMLDGLGSRVAPLVADLSDPIEIQAIVHEEARRVRAEAAAGLRIDAERLADAGGDPDGGSGDSRTAAGSDA